ncbi:MAG: T9SS type A sorting domain-containing protein [Chitinophagales bacterium]|nr:T9SS type A sorting domain-containing protein [Chitinophagales bacterium]
MWQKSFGGSGFEWANDALENSDGSLMIAGSTTSVDGDVSANYSAYPYEHDIWLIKLDANGNLLWERNFGGSGKDECRSFRKTNDGNYCLSGSTTSTDFDVSDNNGASDFWLIKIDTGGTIIWQQTYGGNKEEESYAVAALADSSFAIIGWTFSSQSGDVTDNCINGSDSVYSNIWMMKTGAEVLVSGFQESLPLLNSIKILPNPITTSATIQFTLNIASHVSVKLYDVSGREIMTILDDEMEPEMHSLQFYTSLFPKGIYFVRMITENGIENQKLIVQ